MSDWFYVGITYGLTWVVLISYFVYLGRRTRRAEDVLGGIGGDDEPEALR